LSWQAIYFQRVYIKSVLIIGFYLSLGHTKVVNAQFKGNEIKEQDFTFPRKIILLSLFISIAGGKWGSYIGFPGYSLFLTDLLFTFGCFLVWIKSFSRNSGFFLYGLLGLTFFIIQFYRNPEFSLLLKLRDLVPFFYLLFVPLLIKCFAGFDKKSLLNTLRYASIVHLIWLIPVIFGVLKPITLNGVFGFPVFTPRWDLDGMALILGLLAWRQHPKYNLKENNLVSIILILVIVIQYSRAVLVAFLTILIIYFLRSSRNRKIQNYKLPFKFFFLLLISGSLILVVLPVFQDRLPKNSVLVRIGLVSSTMNGSVYQQAADSTANSRLKAQFQLLGWIKHRGELVLGSGPGVEMVRDSGAVQYLSGDPTVRSPHSWIFGLLCRYGYVGVLMWLYLIIFPLIKTKAIKRPLDMPMTCIIVIFTVSLFGVIIESPFGSLPLAIFVSLASID
jgi:hypothetical protein